MVGFDPQLLIAWGIVAISLGLQFYLFATWPVPRDKNSSPGPAQDGTESRRPVQVAWADESLDDVIQLSGWETAPPATNAGARRVDLRSARRKQKSPVTLKQRIICAGIYNKRGVWTFHVVRAVSCLTMFCGGLLVAPLVALPWAHGFIFGALAGLAGYLLPSFWLDHRLRGRQTKMRRALPDALDLITVCMQGGLSLPAALARVSRELGTAHPMLATELAIVEREIQMGRTTGEAMRQFANRFNLEELRSLSSVVGQAEKFGGSITGALRTYAVSLRVKRRQHAEEMAQKAAVKLLFPTLLCIFPGIFVVILGPTAIRMYQVMIAQNPWGG